MKEPIHAKLFKCPQFRHDIEYLHLWQTLMYVRRKKAVRTTKTLLIENWTDCPVPGSMQQEAKEKPSRWHDIAFIRTSKGMEQHKVIPGEYNLVTKA